MKINVYKFIVLVTVTFTLACKNDTNQTDDSERVEKTEIKFEDQSKPVSTNGSYEIDNSSSIISWKGSKPAGTHFGEIKVKSGEMKFNDGEMIAGKFTADMTSINVMDLEGEEKVDLENHLKGNIEGKEDHFFNVKKYPESQFIVKSVKPEEDKYRIYGELIIKGTSNPIEFLSTLEFGNDNKTVKLITDEFEIDRTKWGIEFMSKSVFDDLKERFIDDEVRLKIELKANKTY
jgi:polyisoprenoid-binding protein YceI